MTDAGESIFSSFEGENKDLFNSYNKEQFYRSSKLQSFCEEKGLPLSEKTLQGGKQQLF